MRRIALFLALIGGLTLGAQTAAQERRVALVIGNGAYRTVRKLANPANDAQDMAVKLKELGFVVTKLVDAEFGAMEKARRDFSAAAPNAQVRLFYFAGHGVQAEGQNWLLPVDADIKEDYELKAKAISAQVILDGLEKAGAGVNLVILDACRDNPFKGGLPGAGGARGLGESRGLAVMGISGSLIAYATAPGLSAADGDSRNGIFTEALLAELDLPGRSVQELMASVTARVSEATKGSQVPWMNVSLPKLFYFVSPEEARARFAGRIAEGERALKALETELASLRQSAAAEADAARRSDLELEIKRKEALDAQKRQETEDLKVEQERQEAAFKARAEEEAQLDQFKKEQAEREEEIRKAAEAYRAELAGYKAGAGGAQSLVLTMESARSARAEIERQYADSLTTIVASAGGAYDRKLGELASWKIDPWENEREFRARVGAERSRLESEKQAALSEARADNEAKRKAALAPFFEAESEAAGRLEASRSMYRGDSVRLEIDLAGFDREEKRFPISLSSAFPELAYRSDFFYSIKSDTAEELKRRYLEFEAWHRAGALFGEIEASVLPAGTWGFANQIETVRLRVVEASGERVLYENTSPVLVSTFERSSDRARARPLTGAIVVTAPGADIFWKGEFLGRNRALLPNPDTGVQIFSIRLPDGTRLEERVSVGDSAFDRVAIVTTGSLLVSTRTAGELLVDGRSRGRIEPGSPITLDPLPAGQKKAEIRYQDGKTETMVATVSARSQSRIDFSYETRMVKIPAGSFTMGSPASEKDRDSDEGPQHEVRLSAFSIGQYEVTQAEWQSVMGSNPSDFKGDDRLPVENVSWYDILVYCNKRSLKEGLTPCYSISGSTDPGRWGSVPTSSNSTWNSVVCNWSANGYRLPTEAEWEYACRAGTSTATAFGNTLVSSQANFDGNYSYNVSTKGPNLGKSTAVGSYTANAWGLYDMHGNVWEKCWDWKGNYSSSSQTDPRGADSGSYRVLRGGSWSYLGYNLRSATRRTCDPDARLDGYGFRVVVGGQR